MVLTRPVPTLVPPPPYIPPILEELVYHGDVIVRASLKSKTIRTEIVPQPAFILEMHGITDEARVAPPCESAMELAFSVAEYLKGIGPPEVQVNVQIDNTYQRDGRLHTHLLESEARAAAEAWWVRTESADRNDDGVLFLSAGSTPAAQGTAMPTEGFHLRAWLPVLKKAPSLDEGDGRAPLFIVESGPSGEGLSPVTMSFADLRSRIMLFETLLKEGEGVAGYTDCIEGVFWYEKASRRDPPYEPKWSSDLQMSSGLPTGAGITKSAHRLEIEYDPMWLDGPDSGYFKLEISDIVDSASSTTDGYWSFLTAARPLPAGRYKFATHYQSYSETLCDFRPNNFMVAPRVRNWTIAVTPSVDGTVHEAFFDPAAFGGMVGFSGTTGSVSPTEFMTGDVTTTIRSLYWESGSVSLDISPPVSLKGSDIDFIALDGSVLMTLPVKDMSIDGETGPFIWQASSQPWRAGDQLMLRIRKEEPVPPAPGPRPWIPAVTNLTSTSDVGHPLNYRGEPAIILQWTRGDAPDTGVPTLAQVQQWDGATGRWHDEFSRISRTSTSAIIFGVTPGVRYSHRVRYSRYWSYGGGWESSEWAYVSTTVPGTPPPTDVPPTPSAPIP